MKNPYPQNTGFGLRLYRAKRALERLGRDCLARIYVIDRPNGASDVHP